MKALQNGTIRLLCLALVLGIVLSSGWCVSADDIDVAIGGTAAEREAAIGRLRAMGPVGLEQLIQRFRSLEQQLTQTPTDPALRDKLASLDQAIERVGSARYCRLSGLYWYTDVEQAKAAAQASGKPILALRMLGNLTDDFSCANSRFFRTTLYANTQISQYLRDHFILTWKSVRPVPRVTIDFGDGRKLERTLTGNSIHYVLTPDGQVVDALPGLYGPQAFLHHLIQAESRARQFAALPYDQRDPALVQYHREAIEQIAQQWQADLEAVTATAAAAEATQGGPAPQQAAPPTARKAAGVARAKSDVELPLLAMLDARFVGLERQTSDELWEAIARRHAADASIDEASRMIIAALRPSAVQAGRVAVTKLVVENPLLRLVRNLEHSIALDTVKNEYTLHRKLHTWLAGTPELARNIDNLNDRVYAELFLTPANDPWLGLAPPDVYTALPNDGMVTAAK